MVLLPFEAPGFEPGTERAQVAGDAIMEQPVQTVTSFAQGPRPVKLAPPGCDWNMQVHNAIPISAKNAFE